MSTWEDIARVVAPTVATGLFGPAGGLVASVVAGFLFPGEAAAKATPTQVAERIGRIADPADMTKLREAEMALRKLEAENEFRFADLARQDVADARAMQRAAGAGGDRTAPHLAWFILISFCVVSLATLGMIVGIMSGGVRMETASEQTWIAVSGFVGAILGYFSANAQQVVGFYFGSSAGSKDKAQQLERSAASAVAELGRAANTPQERPPAPRPVTPVTVQSDGPDRVRVDVGDTDTPDMRPAAPAREHADAEARWKLCATFVLGAEGGEVDDGLDHGGHTNMGITRTTLSRWRGRPVSAEEVSSLAKEEALDIYRAEYWALAHCDQLPAGVDLCVFDTAILRGPVKALRMLQEAAGLDGQAVDGRWGPDTAAAVRGHDPAILVATLAENRARFHRARVREEPSQERFIKGWLNRVEALRREGTRMASADTGAAQLSRVA